MGAPTTLQRAIAWPCNSAGVDAQRLPCQSTSRPISAGLAGAGIDVFDAEPLPAGHPLTKLDNVGLTSHCAGITPEALEAGLALAIENVVNYLNGNPTNVVTR